jgi:hypothetical protein
MRSLSAVLVSLVITTTAFAAGDDERRTPARNAAERLGRAMILHPAEPLTDSDRAELAAKGVAIKHALAGGRYLARVRENARLEGDDRIASLEPLTAAKKIHPSALRAVGRGKTWADVNVFFQRDVAFEDARQAILAAGGALADPFKGDFSPSRRLDARIAPVALEALATDERVLTVAARPRWRVESDNANAALLSRVTELHAAPYGLTGDGVTVSLFELAPAQQSHREFEGRLTVNAFGGTSSDKTHATHVAGTIGAAGINVAAKGMAPKVRIHQYCVASGSNDCKNDWLEDKDELLSPLGVSVDNNSWGYVLGWDRKESPPVWLSADVYRGAYDLMVGAPLDEISNEQNILFVHSAGNDGDGAAFSDQWANHRHVDDDGDTIADQIFCYSQNGSGTDCPALCNGKDKQGKPAGCEIVRHDAKLPYDTIGVTAGAKNIITVGSVSSTGNTNVQIANSSSRGPAKDGRIKPEVVARGVNVFSSVPNDNYTRLSGTSMASPAVTGIAALLVEQWRKTFKADPLPAHLKALIIAGAEDLGKPGPDYTFGFGLVNAKASADIIIEDGGRGDRIRTFTLNQGQTQETALIVDQTQTLRVVLNWPDPPIPFLGGDDIAEKALVNDLDVKVVDPAGNTHQAWVLSLKQYEADAIRGVNNTDNVEMVEIANATPGTYRVIATGTRVTEGPQRAVLVSSARTAPPCRDPLEALAANDSAATAFGNLVPGQTHNGAICTETDIDYYKFVVTRSGPVTVVITTGDTAVRATLTGTGLSTGAEIPANSTVTLSAPAVQAVPLALTLKIEASGVRGSNPVYSFTTQFNEQHQPRRRGARH